MANKIAKVAFFRIQKLQETRRFCEVRCEEMENVIMYFLAAIACAFTAIHPLKNLPFSAV